MATNVSSATKFFPKPQEGFTTTTSGSVSSGATTVGLNSTGNYSNGDTVVLIIDPGVSNKEQSFMGVVDTGGVQLTGVVWTSGTNVAHSSGATVVDYVAAAHIQLLSAGILVSHNADGTPRASITYPTSTFTTPTVTDFTNATHTHASTAQGGLLNGANAITDGTITPAELTSGTAATWAWQTWASPFASGLTTTTGTTNYALYQQTGKTVHCRVGFTLGASSAVTGALVFTLPVTSVSSYVAQGSPLGTGVIQDSGSAFITGQIIWLTTTTAKLVPLKVDGVYSFYGDTTNLIPMTWTTNDGFFVDFEYEAA